MISSGDYINGHIERTTGGGYNGALRVEGIDLSPVEAQFFKKDGDMYLFIKRKPIMEFNYAEQKYITRERRPQVSIYMKKQVDSDGVVSFKGDFMFMRFKLSIVGVWDSILGKEINRLNLFVERAPRNEQTLLQSINERNKEK